MRLSVIVENLTVKQTLFGEWGYSAWLDAGESRILLDTGGILHVWEHNARALGFDPSRLTDVVLSHGHFDHTAGLSDVLRLAPHARVWGAASIARPRWGDADAARLAGGGPLLEGIVRHPIAPHATIAPGVTAFTVPLDRRDSRWICTKNMFEQNGVGCKCADTFEDDVSILVRTERGASVLLGCAHAGLPNILRYAQEEFGVERFHTVIGGTHLCGVDPSEYAVWMRELAQYDVARWRPCHCTGFDAAAVLARTFEDVAWAAAGTVHEL